MTDWRSASAEGAGDKRRSLYCFSLFLSICLFSISINLVEAQSPVRLAIVDFVEDPNGERSSFMRQLVQSDRNIIYELVDQDLTRVAAKGVGYAGNLNLSRLEAQALGRSLGCDFYILGRAGVTRRISSDDKLYFEALAAIFVVETRTGDLIKFIFENAQGKDEIEAHKELMASIGRAWAQSSEAITLVLEKRAGERETMSREASPVVLDISNESEGDGISRPFFYQRIKPFYTEQAELAGVIATVELEAVFEADGRVGEIEVIRWAGFGLDQSAIDATRMLRFKPAERDGKRLTIRALVRYNFRRPLFQAAKPQAQSQEDFERLKRSLGGMQMPGQWPGQNPNF